MQVELKNEQITAVFDTRGAELKSLVKDGREFMWNADPAFWNRTSPVLFPFVGAVKGGVYRYNGYEYPMGQHGFARDMEFEIAGQTDLSVSFRLDATEETKKVYPFDFELTIIYALNKNELKITWVVKNLDNKTMYFSIGAHPAFMIKLDENGTFRGNYLRFDTKDDLEAKDFADGLVKHTTHAVKLDDSCLALDEHTFDNGVLIFEHDQAQKVSILDNNKNAYVTVEFDTPLFGVWAPDKPGTPFICIEPWYGRADADDFDGELKSRRYEQSLEEGVSFRSGYKIMFD